MEDLTANQTVNAAADATAADSNQLAAGAVEDQEPIYQNQREVLMSQHGHVIGKTRKKLTHESRSNYIA